MPSLDCFHRLPTRSHVSEQGFQFAAHGRLHRFGWSHAVALRQEGHCAINEVGCCFGPEAARRRLALVHRARGGAMSDLQLDRAGRRRSPATMPGFLAGRSPRNGDGAHGRRLRGLIVILWRAGLRIQEALDLTEADLDQRRGSLLVRRGKGGRRREVGMDDWGWQELQPWLELRVALPVGPLFCVINGPTRGRPWATAAARARAPTHRGRSRRAPALRAAPASPRPRRRDGARRRAPDRHPAPARPQQPRHHLGLPPGHRQRRDHRHRPRPTRTHGSRQRIATTLKKDRTPAHRAKEH